MTPTAKKPVSRALRASFGVVLLLATTLIAHANSIPRPAGIQDDVNFWIRVYTEVTTNEGFLHDERNLAVVYDTLKFGANTSSRERQRLVDERRDRHIAALRRIIAALPTEAGREALSAEDRKLLELWGPNPSAVQLREATHRIRFQLGQADRFKEGLIRSSQWETHIAETFANQGLPPELAVLPHVESSFNAAAYSKVGAAGMWQFMRSTGKRYMRVDDAVDERLDPYRSTEAAAQLLAYNYRVLGSWPLALTAYNHGAAGMRRAKETVGTDDFVKINRTYNSRTFGFASRNFFPSFLAALTIDENPEKYFGPMQRRPEIKFHEVAMPAYVRLSTLERTLGLDREQLRALNPAWRPPIYDGSRLVPRGYRLRLPADTAEKWTADMLMSRVPANVRCEHSDPVQAAVADLPAQCRVLIMSFSHAEDLDVVAACLKRQRERADLAFIGLIGSKSKWGTFRHRLEARGFTSGELAQVTCPIGVPGVAGKQPEVIAVAVAAQLLQLPFP